MSKPILTFGGFAPLLIHQYERYLPTAFDESMTLLQKVNKVIMYLNQIGEATDNVVAQWNEVMEWIMVDGLTDAVRAKLDEMVADGTLASIINEELFSELNDKIDGKVDLLDESLNWTIGANSLHKTISSALQALSIMRKSWQGKVTLTLESGFVLNEQVLVEGIDYSFVTLKSVTSVVFINTNSLTTDYAINQSPEFTVSPAFACFNGTLPNIDVLFQMDTKPLNKQTITGIFLDNSTVLILPNKGVLNANYIGMCGINGSNMVAPYANFSNSGNREKLTTANYTTERWGDGIRVWGSVLNAPYANADNAGDTGFNISMASYANLNFAHSNDTGHHGLLVTSGAVCSARNGIYNRVIDDAVVAYAGGTIDFRSGTANDATMGSGIVATRISQINFENGQANRCGNGGIYANRGSMIDADSATVTDCGDDNITCANGSVLNFNYGTSTGSVGDNLHVTHGSKVSAVEANLSNAGENGVLAYGACQVSVDDSIITNCGKRGVESTRGAIVNAHGVDATGAVSNGFGVYYGGTINASESTGTKNRTENELTPNGIIYNAVVGS